MRCYYASVICVCILASVKIVQSQNVVTPLQITPSSKQVVGGSVTASVELQLTTFQVHVKFNTNNAYLCQYISGAGNVPVCANNSGSTYTTRSTISPTLLATGVQINTTLSSLTAADTSIAVASIGGDSKGSINLNVQYCGNPSQAGVSAAPANSGFGATHTFNCTTNYTGTATTATCQNDATWNLASNSPCSAACNTTTIPSNTSYVSPSTSELMIVGSSKDLNCTSGYIGSASAVCNAAGDTRSWNITNGCKAVCSQLSADYCVHGTNTNVTTVTEGSDVNVGCCNGKSGSTTAVCVTPGNITLSLDCSQAPRLWIGKFTFSSLQLLATLTIWINCNNFMF